MGASRYLPAKWRKQGGVLLMGYEMYRLLISKKVLVKTGRKTKKAKQAAALAAAEAANKPVVIDLEEEDRNKELLKGETHPSM